MKKFLEYLVAILLIPFIPIIILLEIFLGDEN